MRVTDQDSYLVTILNPFLSSHYLPASHLFLLPLFLPPPGTGGNPVPGTGRPAPVKGPAVPLVETGYCPGATAARPGRGCTGEPVVRRFREGGIYHSPPGKAIPGRCSASRGTSPEYRLDGQELLPFMKPQKQGIYRHGTRTVNLRAGEDDRDIHGDGFRRNGAWQERQGAAMSIVPFPGHRSTRCRQVRSGRRARRPG